MYFEKFSGLLKFTVKWSDIANLLMLDILNWKLVNFIRVIIKVIKVSPIFFFVLLDEYATDIYIYTLCIPGTPLGLLRRRVWYTPPLMSFTTSQPHVVDMLEDLTSARVLVLPLLLYFSSLIWSGVYIS